jgi:membrane protease YdiL (CAAX protease family)
MAVGSKSFPENMTSDAAHARDSSLSAGAHRIAPWRAWAETLWVFVLLESVMWTPRGFGHGVLIALLLISPLWLTWKSCYTRRELGLAWPSEWRVTAWIVAAGLAIALVIPVGALLLGQPLPADPNWPRLGNILPYFVWAIFQQFLLQSFIFLRMESALGSTLAVLASSALFTFAHLPNLPLTGLTLFGAFFFTDLFRRYRSIYPLGIAHFLMGISIAYSFPTSLMHHMRVGLSFGKL